MLGDYGAGPNHVLPTAGSPRYRGGLSVLDFLRVHVHYSGINIEQAEALYFGGQSFLNIASLDSEAKDADLRGRVLLKRCADNYAGSEWGRKAAAAN